MIRFLSRFYSGLKPENLFVIINFQALKCLGVGELFSLWSLSLSQILGRLLTVLLYLVYEVRYGLERKNALTIRPKLQAKSHKSLDLKNALPTNTY